MLAIVNREVINEEDRKKKGKKHGTKYSAKRTPASSMSLCWESAHWVTQVFGCPHVSEKDHDSPASIDLGVTNTV